MRVDVSGGIVQGSQSTWISQLTWAKSCVAQAPEKSRWTGTAPKPPPRNLSEPKRLSPGNREETREGTKYLQAYLKRVKGKLTQFCSTPNRKLPARPCQLAIVEEPENILDAIKGLQGCCVALSETGRLCPVVARHARLCCAEERIGCAKGEPSTIFTASPRFRIRHADARQMVSFSGEDPSRQVVRAAVLK